LQNGLITPRTRSTNVRPTNQRPKRKLAERFKKFKPLNRYLYDARNDSCSFQLIETV
jgi:hypothetical protein